ncbi:MAG TPA: hypothetical protein VFD46_11285 [Chryseolinea sp.]|nr:hypothetical protein [Chryseolinea sp.]
MGTLKVKWSGLTTAQRKQVSHFYETEIKTKQITVNQLSYRVNPTNGNVIFFKDF